MSEVHPEATLRSQLKNCPVLKLTLRDRDYGLPCPPDRWRVKAAIDDLLTPSLEGMVLDLEVLEGPDCDDVLVIGVVDLQTALPKLRDLLKSLNVPSSATLVLDGGTENLAQDLVARDELLREMTERMIQMVLAECIACAPPDWQTGTLTIQSDGNWLGYKLKNAQSPDPATFSGRLRALCEELTVLMWRNGNRWREAVLAYEGTSFTVNFSYEEPLDPIPGRPAAPVAKPWWKIW